MLSARLLFSDTSDSSVMRGLWSIGVLSIFSTFSVNILKACKWVAIMIATDVIDN